MLPDGVASASNQAWNEDDYDDEIFEEKPAKSSLFRSALFPLIPGPGNLIQMSRDLENSLRVLFVGPDRKS